jgi:hypothetical protein
MGYRVFYSYQSDIDKKLNQVFIRTAINKAIANIRDFEMEPLVEGFSNASGNPPLAKTMFDESRKSDIFIADVTFTMSKEWHNPIVLHEDEESISIQIPKGNLKPSPNPNVLLETGYSWALKDYDRTILVMNDAFGHPKNLPVDMDGLRWPITYKLSPERAAKEKKYEEQLNGLSVALEAAIRAAIKSNINYQLEKFKPFKIHSQWRRLHSFPYCLTPNLKCKLVDLRNALINYRGPIRLTGLLGTGKSRLAFEVFQANEELDKDILNESILYYDLLATDYGDISKQVNDLSNLNQLKIIIIDNCDQRTHKRLETEFIGTKIKLLTINTVISCFDTESANIFIDEKDSLEVNEILINERFSGSKASFLIEQLRGNILNTITILESGLNDDNEIDNSIINFISEVISKENIEKGALEFLLIISLFGIIGISGSYKNEVENIKKSFFSIKSNEEIDEIIDVLVSKKLLIKKGDFIIVNSFNEELLGNWLFKERNNITSKINKIAEIRLLDKFADQLKVILKKNTSKELIISLFEKDGILQNQEFINSKEGSLFLNKLVEDLPEQVLKIMSNIIEKK